MNIAKRDGVCSVSGQPIVAGETLIGYQDNKVVLAEYAGPTNKAMQAAGCLKQHQRTTAEQWESFRGEPAPSWMSASVEDIARHIGMVSDAARKYGVQLKWEQLEYGSTVLQIEQAAIAKQSYKYTVGDYLPREATRLDSKVRESVLGDSAVQIREYFGVYYITVNDCVCGIFLDYRGEYRSTCNNLTQENILGLRYSNLEYAKSMFDLI